MSLVRLEACPTTLITPPRWRCKFATLRSSRRLLALRRDEPLANFSDAALNEPETGLAKPLKAPGSTVTLGDVTWTDDGLDGGGLGAVTFAAAAGGGVLAEERSRAWYSRGLVGPTGAVDTVGAERASCER